MPRIRDVLASRLKNVRADLEPERKTDTPTSASFVADQVVAGRFRIVRLLARGGMGEVYEAQDLDLNERVALKAIRAEIGDDEQSRERFKREIQLARKVTHPNVCRTFDSVRHAHGVGSDVVLVTMELLRGETLAERLKRSGAMSPDDSLPLVRQMADALQAAHDAGVIHRDFKSANVMLEPGGEGMRVVVTDFGLARAAAVVDGDGRPTAQATSAFIGTPEYMAPEQVEGATITPAADVYALGVVMYEMVSGRCPFSGATPLEIMVRRLKEAPPPPRPEAAALDPRWEAVILRCLERDPKDRFASADDVVRALAGERVSAASGAGARRRRLQTALSAAAALLVVALVGYGLNRSGRATPVLARSLAVLPFSALAAGEAETHLGMGMAEAVTARLQSLRRVPVASSARVLHWTGRGLDPLATGRNLEVDSVLTGTFQREGQRMRVTAELTSVRDGSSLWSDRYDTAFTDILGVQDQIAEHIAAKLVADLTGAERRQLRSHGTNDLEAYELYAKARYHWSRRTPEQIRLAISEFQQATDRDSRFALAYAGLSNAYAIAASGLPPPERFPKAQRAAKRALELDESMAEAHTALAFVSYRWEWSFAGADASFRRAIALRPEYVLAHHWHGELLSLLGKSDAAAAALRRAIALEPESVPARVDLCWALNRAKRFEEAAASCRDAETLDAKEWRAPRGLGLAFEGLGRGDESIQHYLRSESLRGANSATLAQLRAAYDKQGIAGYWRGRIALIQRAAPTGKALPYGTAGALAVIYAGIGEREEALRWLAASLEAKDEGPLSLLDPRWDALRSDPRFLELKQRVGL
jgi:serine/threonine-protein kinase